MKTKALTTSQIRQTWIKYFEKHEHQLYPVQNLVPFNDKSLIFVNSGVATLKPFFEGREVPPAPRLVNAQPAIRTNDIENIGWTTRHHTLFEMLGNFSLGDYFKKEAIDFAYDFLVNELKLDVNHLYITVFSEDTETWNLWIAAGIPQSHLFKGDRTRNFWDMGQGPCGPCTEVYYDLGPHFDPLNQGLLLLKNDFENNRYLEIWNIVFSQYNNDGTGHYHDLTHKNIDTGAGLERLALVLQNVPSTFDTDIFSPIIKQLGTITKVPYDAQDFFKYRNEKLQDQLRCYKVIADHVRTIVFALADGVVPSNRDQGYVVRRLLRRALVYGHQLGIRKAFLNELVPAVLAGNDNSHPQLAAHQKNITATILAEEKRFLETLDSGLKYLEEVTKNNPPRLTGETVFRLFDTYGLPLDITVEHCQKKGIGVDSAGFWQKYRQHQAKSRTTENYAPALQNQDTFLRDLNFKTTFVGYDFLETRAKLVFAYNKDNKPCQILQAGSKAWVVFDKTPFYATAGGQRHDVGSVYLDNDLAKVTRVFRAPRGFPVHEIEVITGQLHLNKTYNLAVTKTTRDRIAANHSATHLLQAALRKIVSSEIVQAGSYLDDEYLRFDFRNPEKLSREQLLAIEDEVNNSVAKNLQLAITEMSLREALTTKAIRIAGEKYAEQVRVVSFGETSQELCGGTHVPTTSEIECFLITNFESKGANVWRINAVTKKATAINFIKEHFATAHSEIVGHYQLYKEMAIKLKMPSKPLEKLYSEITERMNSLQPTYQFLTTLDQLISSFQATYRTFIQDVKNYETQNAAGIIYKQVKKQMIDLDFLHYYFVELTGANFQAVQKVLDQLKKEDSFALVVLILRTKNKTNLLIGAGRSLVASQWAANQVLNELQKKDFVRGGGNNQFARAQVRNENALKTFLDAKNPEGLLA